MTTTPVEQTPRARSRREIPTGVILVLGVIVIPVVLSVLSIEPGVAPDAEAYVRMAFATVAGQTVAIVTAAGVFVAALMRGFTAGARLRLGLIAAVVTSLAIGNIGRAMQTLLPCRSVATLDSDHSPFLSCPEALVEALIQLAA